MQLPIFSSSALSLNTETVCPMKCLAVTSRRGRVSVMVATEIVASGACAMPVAQALPKSSREMLFDGGQLQDHDLAAWRKKYADD